MAPSKTINACGIIFHIHEKSIVAGSSTLFYNRPIEKRDIDAVQRLIDRAYDEGRRSVIVKLRSLYSDFIKAMNL